MGKLDFILKHNEQFVQNKEYESYKTSKYPDKKILILGCMDTRLTELLPKAMGIKNGDAKIIKNAGAIITDAYSHEMRSMLISVYEFEIDEVYIVGHYRCGVKGLKSDYILKKVISRGISKENIEKVNDTDVDLQQWLDGFETEEESVKNSIDVIKNHPLMPENLIVHGLVICPETGKLDLVVNGYK